MPDLGSVDVDMRAVMRRVTMAVTVRREREMRVRTWFAVRLIKMAARILGCDVEVNVPAVVAGDRRS